MLDAAGVQSVSLMLGLLAVGCGGIDRAVQLDDASTDVRGHDADARNDRSGPEGGDCNDSCDALGQKRCLGDGVGQCVGHPTNAGCLQWATVQACVPPEVCHPSKLVCTTEPLCGADCKPFSVVLLPDTQYYTAAYPNNGSNPYLKQTQWVVDNRLENNIKYVIHLGDITHNNTKEEWETAKRAHGILDEANMPYSVVPGNHDYFPRDSWTREQSMFDQYFGYSQFKDKPWYGGRYGIGESNTSNYGYFNVGDLKFLVLSLEYAPRKGVLCWAEDVISKHPGHFVIIATHCYLTKNGSRTGSCPSQTYATTGGSGITVWEELASRHNNVILVVSGHIGGAIHTEEKGHSGNIVHQMLVNYQFEATCNNKDQTTCTSNCFSNESGKVNGNGWMRELVFDPLEGTVTNRTFSVEQDNPSFFGPSAKASENKLYCSEFNEVTGNRYYASDPTSPKNHASVFKHTLSSISPYTRNDGGLLAFLDRTVNDVATGEQLNPNVAMAPGGSFVAVWQDDSSKEDGAGNYDVMVNGFLPGGCSGFPDRLVHESGAGNQITPALSMDENGDFVVVWADNASGEYQILAKGFKRDGSTKFGPITVNSSAKGRRKNPCVAVEPKGKFVVSWEEEPASDGNANIVVRGLNADGTSWFGPIIAHSAVPTRRKVPSIAIDASSRSVVTWQGDNDGNGSYQIYATGLDALGQLAYGPFTVNSVGKGQHRSPAIAMSHTGQFVIAWEDDQNAVNKSQILARGFGADGKERIPGFRVDSGNAVTERMAPTVAMDPTGRFVILWRDNKADLVARGYHATGTNWRNRWKVNRQNDGDAQSPHAYLRDGRLVTIWRDDMDKNGVGEVLVNGVDL